MLPRALAVGVGAALALALPAVLFVQIADALADGDGAPAVVYPLAVVVLIGMGLGGWVASRRGARPPAVAGAVVGLVAVALVQGLGIARRLAAGEDIAWEAVPVTMLAAAAIGAGAAALAAREPGRTRP